MEEYKRSIVEMLEKIDNEVYLKYVCILLMTFLEN